MKKLYYSIGEAGELSGAELHMIRYWETKIKQLKPKKDKRGKRLFTEDDIALISHLKTLIVDKGYSVDGAQKELNNRQSEDTKPEISDELKRDLGEIRQFLVQLSEQL